MSVTWQIRQGDCVELMRDVGDCSVYALICDPPYGLEFMGKEWDAPWKTGEGFRRARNQADSGRDSVFGGASRRGPQSIAGVGFQTWCEAWAGECLRILKPGGHLLAFGGTRTYHRLASGVEDAGFEIRDCLAWLFGSGFPKSLDVSKAIDRRAGAEREVIGHGSAGASSLERVRRVEQGYRRNLTDVDPQNYEITAPATPEAERWRGWGTALKPAHEPIVVARKPLVGSVAANVLEHDAGALNVDGCRIEGPKPGGGGAPPLRFGGQNSRPFHDGARPHTTEFDTTTGRWPANVVIDDEAARMLDEQTGTLQSGREAEGGHRRNGSKFRTAYGNFAGTEREQGVLYGDSGGASRFFYCAKASRAERNAGLEGFAAKPAGVHDDDAYVWPNNGDGSPRGKKVEARANHHPTVKPIELMRWLCRLVTPPGGTVLDPFTGSGTTGCAAVLEGFNFIGFEREAEYTEIAEARITWWHKHRCDGRADAILAAGEARDQVEAEGQMSIFDD